MEIRSVTLFCEPDLPPEAIRRFATAARGAFPLPVQTIRLATPPFPDWWTAVSPTADTVAAQSLAAGWQAAGIDYASLGPVLLRHDAAWLRRIPTLLAATDSLFASAEIASTTGEIDTGRCLALAGIVRQVSTLRPDGFGNLYLTALAHCPPGSPFFPVAYHAGGPPAFAVAVESADLALAAIRAADTLAAARANLVAAIEMAAAEVTTAANALADRLRLRFAGIDFSLAPYPTADKSLGGALEALGLPHVGAAGSLFAAGLITEAIARADFPRCGFSGLMLPVLEDAVLAQRAAEGRLTLQDLLSYAAVCGVGLDTVPLPGDVEQDALAGILLDVAMLAARLRKPLTARLMPLPGLAAGDPVTFDFPYFADSRVMPVRGAALHGPLAAPARLPIASFHETRPPDKQKT